MASQELQRLIGSFRTRRFDPATPEETVRRRLDGFATLYPTADDVVVEPIELAGRPAERVSCGSGPQVLYLHGGGFVSGSPRSHRHLAARLAADLGGTVYVLDYRLAPESPFPAAADDCVAAYLELGMPMSLAGDSAGGNLVLTTAIELLRRGAPAPEAVVAISPWVNLGTDNASYDLLASCDPLLSREVAEWHTSRYLTARSPGDPAVSPLFADLRGLPPTLIQVGDREVFFGDAVHLHQRLIAAGVDSELAVYKAMFHVWHLYWPDLTEGRAAIAAAAAFIGRHA